jgi:hypothetical protein
MPKNAFFVMALEGLIIQEDLGAGDKIASDVLITNDVSTVGQNTTQSFREMIGNLEYRWFKECGTIVYSHCDVEYDNHKLHQPFVVYNLRKVQNFLDALWLYQDNSVRFNLGFAEVKKPNMPPIISSSNLDVYYYNSKGATEPVTISRDYLKKVRLKRVELWGELPDFKKWLEVGFHDYQNYMNKAMQSRSTGRILRCFFFLNAARAQSVMGIKITNYTISLECLFSTDKEELSHKVSERVAFFLQSEGINKRTAYDDVRMAYKVRSAIVHGDALPRKITDVSTLAQKCDDYLRKALFKIISSTELRNLFDTGDSKHLADYLLSLYLP